MSTALTNQQVGLEETDDELWTVSFASLVLGTLHYPSSTFIDDVRWKSDDPPPEENRKPETVSTTMAEDLPMLPV